MSDMKKLDKEQLEQVTGGAIYDPPQNNATDVWDNILVKSEGETDVKITVPYFPNINKWQ